MTDFVIFEKIQTFFEMSLKISLSIANLAIGKQLFKYPLESHFFFNKKLFVGRTAMFQSELTGVP